MSQHRAMVKVSMEFLTRMLHLPKDHHIREVHQSFDDRMHGAVQIIVEGPSLPTKVEGAMIPQMDALVMRDKEVKPGTEWSEPEMVFVVHQ